MGANPHLFNIVNEAELSEVLSHYDTDYVLGVVDNALQNRFNSASVIPQPNVVVAWEQNFKQLMMYYEYDEFKAKINAVRETTYKEIIARICKEFDLNFTIDDTIDLYSAAYYLYDFFVSSFNIYLIQFFSQYIFKERASIYEAMGLAEMRKNKDSSTTYGKRLYKDIRLAVINANIDRVISFITGTDIDLGSIFSLVLIREKANYLATLVSERNDFFKTSYAGILNSVMRPILLTEIRFRLQGFAKAHEPEIVEGNENEE